MRKTALFAIASAPLIAAGSLLLSGTALGTNSAEPGGGTLYFDVQFSPFNLIDLGGQGLTDGDEIVFHDRLLDHGSPAGDQLGSCVIVDAAESLANCTGVIRLPGGHIAFQFANSPPPEKTLAITGGTGRYRTVHGEGTLVESATGPTGALALRLR